MSAYPTGMGANTAIHYNNVAAQLHAYVENSNRPYYPPPPPDQYSLEHLASRAFQHGIQQLGVDPRAINQVGSYVRQYANGLY